MRRSRQAQRDHLTAELPRLQRQVLRKVLAAPIAVRPTTKGEWRFAGFSRFDVVLAGGVGKGFGFAEIRDYKTTEQMIAWLNAALGIEGALDRGRLAPDTGLRVGRGWASGRRDGARLPADPWRE